MACAREVAAELAVDLRDTHSAVIVCDDFGVILDRAGTADVLRSSEQVNLVPGGVWNEKAAGTNAIGLALGHRRRRLRPDCASALAVERRLEQQVFGRERELLEHHMRGRAGQQPPYLTVDRGGHTIIQNARMLQSASSEDVELLLSFAGHALRCESDRTELLELSCGRSRAEAHLIYGGLEVLGAVVSIHSVNRDRGSGGCASPVDWAPLTGRSPGTIVLNRLHALGPRARSSSLMISMRWTSPSGRG